jgi:hypothetical protein
VGGGGGELLGVVDGLDEVVVVDVDVVVDVEVLLLCCHFFFLLPVLLVDLENKLEQRWQGSSLFSSRERRRREKKICFGKKITAVVPGRGRRGRERRRRRLWLFRFIFLFFVFLLLCRCRR